MNINTKIFISFWLFGLLNNSLYVVILSAANDLVGSNLPKSLILLFDILPSLSIKLISPFFIKYINYEIRIITCVCLSFLGMIIISNNDLLYWKLIGIIFASLSSGLGEITFLSLSHYYKALSLNSWSSGTGFAGIFGSLNYLILTTWLGLSVRKSLNLFCLLPFLIMIVFWKILPIKKDINEFDIFNIFKMRNLGNLEEEEVFLNSVDDIDNDNNNNDNNNNNNNMKDTFKKIKPLIIPYMIPLSTVYIFEYLINQAISPTLLFDIKETPFKETRDIYVFYSFLYQIGVFVSRSSGNFIRIRKLYLLSFLQLLNLLICLIESMNFFINNIYIIFLIIIWEGLLGGSSYVNTFQLINEEVEVEKREFSLGTVSISDSLGIGIASLIGMVLEGKLCEYQVSHGRDYCIN